MAVSLALASCHHGRPTIEKAKPSAASDRHPVQAMRVAAPGIVEPWRGEVRLASAEAGLLTHLSAEEGRPVRRGEVLGRLEDSAQRQAVALAQAEVSQAEALLAGAAATPEEVRAAAAELEAATARATQQRRDQERAESLGDKGAISAADVERTTSSARADQAEADAATARLLIARRGARPPERRLARARLDGARARLESARAALERREVCASVDGVVLWSRRHAGEYYEPGQGPLVVLGDVSKLQVRLEIDDGDGDGLHPGAPCELRNDAGAVLAEGAVHRLAIEYGSRTLVPERPTARTDARVREAFVEVAPSRTLAPGLRVWGYCARSTLQAAR